MAIIPPESRAILEDSGRLAELLETRNQSQLARELECSTDVVRKARRRHGIDSTGRAAASRQLPRLYSEVDLERRLRARLARVYG